MEKTKRGQLTLFIIIAILIVAIILTLIFYVNPSLAPKTHDQRIAIFKTNFLECFEESYKHALEVIGSQGGLITYPDFDYYDAGFYFYPYYYNKGESLLPEITKIQEEIGKFSQVLAQDCLLRHTRRIEDYDFMIYKEIKVIPEIYYEKVLFKTELELTILSENISYIIDFSDSEIIIPSKLKESYELAQIIIEQTKESDMEWIDLTLISTEAKKRGLNISIINDEKKENVHLFTIKTNQINYYPNEFNFMGKYNFYEIGFPGI